MRSGQKDGLHWTAFGSHLAKALTALVSRIERNILDSKMLIIMSFLPYQIAMLLVILGVSHRIDNKPLISKRFEFIFISIACLFFILGVAVSLLPVIYPDSEVKAHHWLSFYLSSMLLANFSHKFKGKVLASEKTVNKVSQRGQKTTT